MANLIKVARGGAITWSDEEKVETSKPHDKNSATTTAMLSPTFVDPPSFEQCLFDLGIKIGRLPGRHANWANYIALNFVEDLEALDRSVQLLADPRYHSPHLEAGCRPRVWAYCMSNNAATLDTVLSESSGSERDFVKDPRTHGPSTRPKFSIFRILDSSYLFDSAEFDETGIRSALVKLIVAGHQKAWNIINEKLDLIMVESPVAMSQRNGECVLHLDNTIDIHDKIQAANKRHNHQRAYGLLQEDWREKPEPARSAPAP